MLTPKQVLFFTPVIEELKSEGCEVLATSRRYREVEPMARMQSLLLRYIGERGGKDPADQLAASTRRQEEIIPIVKEFAPDVAISVASAVCARVAYGLGTKHVAVNDSPHSEVAGRLSLPLSHHLLCPWVIPFGAWAKFGLSKSQITRYRALDPAAWLKRKWVAGPIPKLDPGKKTITVRLEESQAPYLARADKKWTDVVLNSVAGAFPDCNLVALCRYGDQLEETNRKFGDRFIVPAEVVDGRTLLCSTDVFVGMGGTMSAESALMGVPTISTFQGSLFTEKYLMSVRLLTRATKVQSLTKCARRFLGESYKRDYSKRAERVLASMEDPVPKIARSLIEASKQG